MQPFKLFINNQKLELTKNIRLNAFIHNSGDELWLNRGIYPVKIDIIDLGNTKSRAGDIIFTKSESVTVNKENREKCEDYNSDDFTLCALKKLPIEYKTKGLRCLTAYWKALKEFSDFFGKLFLIIQ